MDRDDLLFLVLQFLDKQNYKEALHSLERESRVFFNLRYFEENVMKGEWDELEKYLSGFTKLDDNPLSIRIFFEIRQQKFLEALDRGDNANALKILRDELNVFAVFNKNYFRETAFLVTLDNIREAPHLSKYVDAQTARASLLVELRRLFMENPLLRDKLQLPTLPEHSLQTKINQSLNWQHMHCENPMEPPIIRTLFVDHTCEQLNTDLTLSPVINSPMGSTPGQKSIASSSGGPKANPSTTQPAGSERPIAPDNHPSLDCQIAFSEQKRPGSYGMTEEVNVNSSDNLPKTVVANLNQGSTIKSMDFHPMQQTLLLVGTVTGEVALWEVSSRKKLAFRNFKVWDIGSCSAAFQASLANEYVAPVNRVAWNPDGTLFGVAYSKNILHLYSYHGGDDVGNHIEIDAHVGSVSDLAFAQPNKNLCAITCGEDKTIKVWDAITGANQYTLEGHKESVYSVFPHYNKDVLLIYSMAVDGKIKAWLYDNMVADYDAPGCSCTRMAYNADRTRIFLCGTNQEGESYLVEWNLGEGGVKQYYLGLRSRSDGVVQFDTTSYPILAAGDEFAIKFWDMNNPHLLTTADAEGGLPACPCIRFNKAGTLLAVSTIENGFKILANAAGALLVPTIESGGLNPSGDGDAFWGRGYSRRNTSAQEKS